jgi:soluble lytic murein transglycosylase
MRDGKNPGEPEDPLAWALAEGRFIKSLALRETEAAALEGHLETGRGNFAGGLEFFRAVLSADPPLFFTHPGLINDLGRCFQFTGSNDEGIKLFLEWDKSGEISGDIRYRLLYFAARIARQRGTSEQAMELFTKALACAPQAEQEDACIWYILDIALGRASPDSGSPAFSQSALTGLVKSYMSRWNNDSYFSDILDRLACMLVRRRQWVPLAEIFALLQDRAGGAGADTVSLAKYACILGRAAAEGYSIPAGTAEELFRTAYGAGTASFYYRAQSAAFLREPFLVLPDDGGKQSQLSDAALFLLGFFEYGAAEHIGPYLNSSLDRQNMAGRFTGKLEAGELRAIAEAFTARGQYSEAMRVVSYYINDADYTPNRTDLELLYPRPYLEAVEKYAGETELEPALLFGLIRTESAFQNGIVSRAGAIGLTQLMPATAEEMAGRIKRQGGPDYTRKDDILTEADANIHIGAVYLKYLLDRLKSPVLALLAYNGGMNRIRRWRAAEQDLPEDLFLETIEFAETREYGRRVLAAEAVYKYLYY